MPGAAIETDAGPTHESKYSLAIVHDYLNQFGGAEQVVLELARIWPNAPIYTSLYRPGSTFAEFAGKDVRTSVLDRVPVDAAFRALAPLYPLGFRSLGTLDYDVVLSTSSGWAHGVRTGPATFHLVYCFTPARWLYGGAYDHLGPSIGQKLLAPLAPALRRWDKVAAARADLYVTMGENIRRRISTAYGRDAIIVPPPVDTGRFQPTRRGERLLVVSRLLPYKRVDLIVRAAAKAGIGLDVVGDGPSRQYLEGLADRNVKFHGRLAEESVVNLIEGCRALCVAAAEDFGLTPLEANAAGKPVVAYGAGGVLETMKDGVTAALFYELDVDHVCAAIRRADELTTSPAELRAAAERFSASSFRERMRAVVDENVAARGGAYD